MKLKLFLIFSKIFWKILQNIYKIFIELFNIIILLRKNHLIVFEYLRFNFFCDTQWLLSI